MIKHSKEPLVVDIKRHSLEDGPGIRTVVFFKGCPLRCVFCQNPETQNSGAEIAFSPVSCIGCRRCGDVCPSGAIDMGLPGRVRREACTRCGRCAEACPGSGLRYIGKQYSVEEIVEIALKDFAYYRHSGGGVTLSGGECTMHPAFLEKLLARLKEKDVNVAIETSGFFDFAEFSMKILPYVDYICYDIKIIDSDMHLAYTGRSNRLILDNFRRLVRLAPEKVVPRVPLVPGITATEGNLKAIIDFLYESGARSWVLLPYNPAGLEMCGKLGKAIPVVHNSFMKIEEEIEINEFVNSYAKSCREPA